MKELRFPLIVQTALGLILGLWIGLLLQSSPLNKSLAGIPTPTSTPVPTSLPLPTLTPTPTVLPSLTPTPPLVQPLVTLHQVYSLQVTVYRQKPPEVIAVQKLPEGRLVITQSGDSKVEMFDSTGKVVYSQSFHPIFLSGEPLKTVDQRTLTFILPADLGGVKIRVSTPQGEVEYELPTNP